MIRRYTKQNIKVGEVFQGSPITSLKVSIQTMDNNNIIDVEVITEKENFSLLHDIAEM